MKKRSTTPSASAIVEATRSASRLIKLVPVARQKYAKGLIHSYLSRRDTSLPQISADYHHRLAHSVVALETEEAQRTEERGGRDPISVFSIGTEGSVDRPDPALGVCHIAYHNFSHISSGWFAGGLWLEPRIGGVSFTFLDGLPEGATVTVFLNWSAGRRIGVLNPPGIAVPKSPVTASTGPKGSDFQWTMVRRSRPTLLCMNDANPGDNGTIAFGAACRVFYY